MLDRGDGQYEVAHVDLHPDGRYEIVWRNFPQMIHFALAETRRQQEFLLFGSQRMTRHVNGVPAPWSLPE